MNIFRFEKGIVNAIKSYIDANLASIADNIEYLEYEPAPNEVSSYADEDKKGVVAVYVRSTEFPTGSQNGNWHAESIIEIDCYGFSKGAHRLIDGRYDVVESTEAANLQSQALITSAFLAVTKRYTLEDSFGVVDGNNNQILIGEKQPLGIELFTQENIESTQIAECVRKLKIKMKIEEQTIQLNPGEILSGFNYGLEAFNNEESFEGSQQ